MSVPIFGKSLLNEKTLFFFILPQSAITIQKLEFNIARYNGMNVYENYWYIKLEIDNVFLYVYVHSFFS